MYPIQVLHKAKSSSHVLVFYMTTPCHTIESVQRDRKSQKQLHLHREANSIVVRDDFCNFITRIDFTKGILFYHILFPMATLIARDPSGITVLKQYHVALLVLYFIVLVAQTIWPLISMGFYQGHGTSEPFSGSKNVMDTI